MNFRILSLVLLTCLVGHLSTALARQSGTFVPAGTMTIPRWGHKATLLADGRVLITGGAQGNGPVLSAAEIYDPATGTFSATGDLNAARFAHSATLLSDGKVLVAGGLGGGGGYVREILGDAELFDPSTGTFTPVGRMVTAQFNHAATLLPDGRVLVAGGQIASADVVSAGAEIYDPSTGSFVSTGAYAARSALWSSTAGPLWPTATLLPGGAVLIAGNNPAELYDPLTGAFRVAGTMTTAEYQYGMYWHSSTLLLNGKVLIAGGTDDNFRLANAELYDPATETFEATGRMAMPRSSHTANLLLDGRVLIAGGDTWFTDGRFGLFGGSSASAEYYDPDTGTFLAAGNMSIGRSGHTATLLTDGTVLITGGIAFAPFQFARTPPLSLLASAELFVPADR